MSFIQGINWSSKSDAFSRLRVSAPPLTLVDNAQIYDNSPLSWETSTNGTGASATYQSARSSTSLVSGTANGGYAIYQSPYVRYQPGKSQFIVITAVLGAAVTNSTKRVGYFDDNNGIFFQLSSSGLAVVSRSSVSGGVVDTSVLQSAWNLDKLDGTGASGITLDTNKAQIFVIDLQWLGVGRVRCGFSLNGQIVYAHEFLNANSVTSVYMQSANLPVRYESRNSAASAGATLEAICASVLSEGGAENDRGYIFTADNSINTVTAASGTLKPILSIRPALTFASKTNRVVFEILNVSLYVQTNPVRWALVWRPATIATPSWTAVPNSAVEKDVASTSYTGGYEIASGYTAVSATAKADVIQSDILSRLPFGLNIAGSTASVLTLVAAGIGGNAPCLGAFSWRELR